MVDVSLAAQEKSGLWSERFLEPGSRVWEVVVY